MKWSKDEIEKLVTAVKNNETFRDIAKKLGRSYDSVQSKYATIKDDVDTLAQSMVNKVVDATKSLPNFGKTGVVFGFGNIPDNLKHSLSGMATNFAANTNPVKPGVTTSTMTPATPASSPSMVICNYANIKDAVYSTMEFIGKQTPSFSIYQVTKWLRALSNAGLIWIDDDEIHIEDGHQMIGHEYVKQSVLEIVRSNYYEWTMKNNGKYNEISYIDPHEDEDENNEDDDWLD